MKTMKVAPIFTNHMVLQRNKKINIWGAGIEGKEIKVSIKDSSVRGKVKDGQWMVQLPTFFNITNNIDH